MQRIVVREQSLRFRILTPQYRIVILRLDIQGIFYFKYWNETNRTFFNLARSRQCRFNAYGDILHKLVIEQDEDGFLADRIGDLEILSSRFISGFPDQVQIELFFRSALNEFTFGLVGSSCDDQMSNINRAIERGKHTVRVFTDRKTKLFLNYLRGRFPILDSPLILPVPTPENIDLMRKDWAIEILNRLGENSPGEEIIQQVMSNFEDDTWFKTAVEYIIEKNYPSLKSQMTESSYRLLQPVDFLTSAKERWLSFLADRIQQNDNFYNRPPSCHLRHTMFNHFPAIEEDRFQVQEMYQDLLLELRRANEIIDIVENLTRLPVNLTLQEEIKLDLNEFTNAKNTILGTCDLIMSYYDFEKNCARQPLPSDSLSITPIIQNPIHGNDPFSGPQRGWTDPVNPAWNDYRISDQDRSNFAFEKTIAVNELESLHNLLLHEISGETVNLNNDYDTVFSFGIKRHAPLRQYISESRELIEVNKNKSDSENALTMENLFSSIKKQIIE